MAITRQSVTVHKVSGQDPASQSQTVPSGCKQLRFFWTAFGSQPFDIATCTLDGNALTEAVGLPGAGNANATGVLYIDSPTVGTRTLDWSWSGTPSEGPLVFVECITADGTLEIIDADADARESSDTASATSTSATGDYAVALGQMFGSAVTIGGTGASSIQTDNFTDEFGDFFELTAGSGTTTATAGTNFASVALLITREGAEGSEPTVSSRSPNDGENYVGTHPAISITFGEDVKAGSGDFRLIRTGVGTVATIAITNSSQVTFSGATVSFHLTAPLLYSTDYHIEIDDGAILAVDDDGAFSGYSGSTAWNFRTDDQGSLCKVGAFSSGTGAASTTVQVSGVGFMPKLVLFWWSGQTSATDAVGSNHTRRGFGFAHSPSARGVITTQSEDASGSADCDSGHRTDACVATLSIAGAIDGLLDLQSMDADGFTLVVDDAMPNSVRIGYMAIGGHQVEQVATGVLTEPAATGNQDITSPGWQPDAALFMSANIGADPPGTAVDTSCCFGVAAGATPTNYVWAGGSNHNATVMQTISYCRGSECIALIPTAVTSTDAHASVSTWLSTGFRLNWTERAGSRRVLWVAIKGGGWFAGDLLTQTDTTTDIVASGFGFTPKGALFLSHGQGVSTSDTVQDNDRWSMGAFSDASTEVAMGTLDDDGADPSECSTAVEHDNVYVNIALDDTVDGSMQCISVEPTGFTCEMTNADPAQAFVWYLAFGSPVKSSAPFFDTRTRHVRQNPTYRM